MLQEVVGLNCEIELLIIMMMNLVSFLKTIIRKKNLKSGKKNSTKREQAPPIQMGEKWKL